LVETDFPISPTAAAYPCAVALYLVRHGRPILDTAVPASAWVLDPEHEYLVEELAAQAPWPDDAVWYSSPEPKAARTAFLLAKREVPMVGDLREHDRGGSGWVPDFAGAVREALTSPHVVARPGWEPIVRTRSRVVAAVRKILAKHPGRDVVLVGHGTAWTLLAAELTGTEPDLERWGNLAMPDVVAVGKTTLMEPANDAPPDAWREHLWARLEADARRRENWAIPLVDELRDDPLVGALFPVFSHSVLHLRTGHRYDDDTRLVAMVRPVPDMGYAALAPADGEVFGAWGEFLPWPRYLDVEATADALRAGLATRETRRPVMHEWTLHDVDGNTVARLQVTAIDTAGLLGTLVIEDRHPLAEAVAAARAAPHVLPGVSDIPETWNRVDPGALADLTARSETGAALGPIVLRVCEGCVWWGPET
jgi:broad specificity phosphatase PhoE